MLARRAQELAPPIQMCDALTRNLPKLPAKLEVIVSPCLAHARQNGERLGRPFAAALPANQIRRLYRDGLSKPEIARRLQIGRTSVRRILTAKVR